MQLKTLHVRIKQENHYSYFAKRPIRWQVATILLLSLFSQEQKYFPYALQRSSSSFRQAPKFNPGQRKSKPGLRVYLFTILGCVAAQD